MRLFSPEEPPSSHPRRHPIILSFTASNRLRRYVGAAWVPLTRTREKYFAPLWHKDIFDALEQNSWKDCRYCKRYLQQIPAFKQESQITTYRRLTCLRAVSSRRHRDESQV